MFAKTNFRDINFDMDLFLQIAKSRFSTWIIFAIGKIDFKNFGFKKKSKKDKKDKKLILVDLCKINLSENLSR